MNDYQLAYQAALLENYVPFNEIYHSGESNFEKGVLFMDSLKTLSEPAHEAIQIIYEYPKELRKSVSYQGLTWNSVAKYLMKHKGWKFHKTVKIKKEIMGFLKNA